MSEYWRIDLHTHTMWSKDCLMSFERILRLCERRGIDKIAITDHNTAEGALRMQQLAPDRVIVGEEIMTTKGELLAYFLQETVPAGLTPYETIRRLRDQGAVISVSHPLDRLRKGAWENADLLAIIDQVDALEVFNARCLYRADNEQALMLARQYGLACTAGSDAHSIPEYGRAMVTLRPFSSAGDFLAALREAEISGYVERYSPAYVHLSSKVAKWSKKLHLRRRWWDGG
jgi:hypothetical protein